MFEIPKSLTVCRSKWRKRYSFFFFSLIRNGGERREGSTTAETVRDQNKWHSEIQNSCRGC